MIDKNKMMSLPELWGIYNPNIQKVIAQNVGISDDRADVLQDVYQCFSTYFEQHNGIVSSAWVYEMTRNVVIHYQEQPQGTPIQLDFENRHLRPTSYIELTQYLLPYLQPFSFREQVVTVFQLFNTGTRKRLVKHLAMFKEQQNLMHLRNLLLINGQIKKNVA